jgi:hypothetical protein
VAAVRVFDTPGSVSLRIKLPSGRVVVTTVDEPQTSVELVSLGRRGHDVLEDVSVVHDDRGDHHVVAIEQRPRFRWGPLQVSWDDALEVRVACPTGTDLELATASASVRAEGELGDVAVTTATGDVVLGTACGTLGVKTASGDVSVAEARGEGTLTTVSGDVRVERCPRPLGVRSVSGDVEIETASAPVIVATTSGDVRIERVTGGEVEVRSISGDARIGVGPGTRVWIDAVSVSGTLESQLGLEERPPATADADVVPLRVKTVRGDVSIVRASERVGAGAS